MAGRVAFWALLLAWAVCIALSVIVPAMTDPTGDGFTRGMNRVNLFFRFQIAALVLALPLWLFARSQHSAALRRLGRVPGVVALVETLAVLGLLLWAHLAKPAVDLPPAQAATTRAIDA